MGAMSAITDLADVERELLGEKAPQGSHNVGPSGAGGNGSGEGHGGQAAS